MLSNPPATTHLLFPAQIEALPNRTDFNPEAQTLLIVVAGVSIFTPVILKIIIEMDF